MDQILLYRDTRESILAGVDEKAWRHMLPAAREKALQAEMKAESNLHPALYPPCEDGSAILGHYKAGRSHDPGRIAPAESMTMCCGRLGHVKTWGAKGQATSACRAFS